MRDFVDNNKKLSVKGTRRFHLSFSHVEGAKSVLLHGSVYMGRATDTIVSYNRVEGKWSSLPPAPVRNYAMANYEGQLVLVGGTKNNVASNDIYCFDEVKGEWLNDVIAPLKTPRENAIAIDHLKNLIILGGTRPKLFGSTLKSIEVYCGISKQWFVGPDLPRAGFVLQCASAKGFLYLLYPDGWTIRYCSLNQLVKIALNGYEQEGLWMSINRNVPYTRCSLAVYNDTLLALAGAGSDGHIYAYYPKDERWKRVSCLGSLPAIKNASCLHVGQTELFLCGGDIDMMHQTSQAGYLLMVEEPTPSDDGTSGRHSGSGDSSRSHSRGTP